MFRFLHPARAAAAVALLLAAAVTVLLTAAVALLAAVVVALRTAPAEQARSQDGSCDHRGTVIERLAEDYGETLQSLGMNAEDRVVEVYASRTTGTWTILVTNRDGTACMIEAGEAWENRATPPGEEARASAARRRSA